MGAHWSAAYIGRRYVPGRYDCADLVADVLESEFGVRHHLPGRAASVRGLDAQIDAELGRALRAASEPAEGDVVLMRVVGRRRGVGHHVGVWCRVDGAAHVLHLPAGVGAALHRLRDLPGRGWEVMGVYRLAEHQVRS